MARERDLSLPDRIPEMEQYQDQPMELLPFAFYTLCELDDQQQEAYRRLCTTGCDEDVVKIPPQSRFGTSSLQSIVDYHIRLAREGEFDHSYFLVCVYKGSTSVIAVTLDDDDLECKPDRLWIKMDKSGLLLVNLQIANSDWYEAKEEDLGGPTWPGDDDNDGPSEGDEHGDDDGGNTEPGDEDGADDDGEGDGDYGKAPGTGFHIQVYTVFGVDSNALMREIEPMAYMKKADGSDWVCKSNVLPDAASRDPARYAANIHPVRCLAHPTLEKNYFIVAEEPNFAEEGVQIVHIDWDGQIEGKSNQQLLDFGSSLIFESQRAEVADNGTRAAVFTLTKLAQGHEKWHPKVKKFAVYYANISDGDIKAVKAIDSRWVKRGHGEDRVVCGGSMLQDEIDRGGGFWQVLIRRHVAMCRKYKFVPAFIRQYFIWCGDEAPTADSEVQLVKLDWNGDVRSGEALVEEYKAKASTLSTIASAAHKQLTDIVDGTVEWDGESLD